MKHWLVAGSRVSPFLLFSRCARSPPRISSVQKTRNSDPVTLFSHHCALELYVTTLHTNFPVEKINKTFDRI